MRRASPTATTSPGTAAVWWSAWSTRCGTPTPTRSTGWSAPSPACSPAATGASPRTGLCALALSHAAVGDLERAEQAARRAREVTEPLQDFARVGVATWGLARILALRGEPVEAEALLAELQRLIDRAGEEPYVPGWYATRAQVALWSGDAAAAAGWCEREAFVFPPDLLIAHATARRLLGDRAAATKLLDEARDSPILDAMPAMRADYLAERAQLADPVAAPTTHREALDLRFAHGLVLGCVDSLEALAGLAGAPERAGLLYGAARSGSATTPAIGPGGPRCRTVRSSRPGSTAAGR